MVSNQCFSVCNQAVIMISYVVRFGDEWTAEIPTLPEI